MNRLFRRMKEKKSKKELQEMLDIQISNNKILRNNLRKEQAFSRNLEVGAKLVKEENEKLKNNVRNLQKDNETLAKMLNELVVKYNVKFETIDEKPKRTRKKKGE